MKVFAADNPNYDVRARSSAGGIFSLLAEKILSEGGVVYGASFDESWNVVHKRIGRQEDLDSIRRSKYVFSNLGSSLSDVKKDLEEGKKVMFCSVPCQVAAVRKFAGNNPNLFLIEVVCHGAPKPKYWQMYLHEVCKSQSKTIHDIRCINFRDKRTGWKNYSFTIQFEDGTILTQPHSQNVYMRAFLKNFLLREACFDCKFKYPEGSKADLTLGDFWGIDKVAPELDNNLGTTLVIARTKKGMECIEEFPSTSIDFESAIKFNPAIVSSANKPSDLLSFRTDFQKGVNSFKLIKQYTKLPLIQRIKVLIYKTLHK